MRRGLSKYPIVLSLLVTVCSAALAPAAQVVLDYAPAGTAVPGGGTMQAGGTYGNGGPFYAKAVGAPVGINAAGTSFLTFCVEVGEEFSPGGTYDVVVSDRARSGTNGSDGVDAISDYDILSSQTAFLYSHFMSGTMTSVVATWAGPTQADLEALQDAIWHNEGETYHNGDISSGSMYAKLLGAVDTSDPTSAIEQSGWTGQGNVRVMQMWVPGMVNVVPGFNGDPAVGQPGSRDGRAQDQLVLVPTPTASMAGMSLLSGLALVGWIKRGRITSL